MLNVIMMFICYFLFVTAIHSQVGTKPENFIDFLYQTVLFPFWCLEERWNSNYEEKEKQEYLDNGYYWGEDDEDDE